MHRSVTFNKSTEINAPPQVFLSLNEANGPELWKKTSYFIYCQVVKWHFAARVLHFLSYFISLSE